MNKEIVAMEKKYYAYVTEHIENVQRAFKEMFIDKGEILIHKFDHFLELKDAIDFVESEIKSHDASKFSDEEFDAYRRQFYPTSSENITEEEKKITEERYNQAWEHHYLHNDHHPDYWMDENKKPTDMSLPAIVHMLADWGGMAIKFGGTPKQYYYEKAEEEKSKMTENTKSTVEELLNIIYP